MSKESVDGRRQLAVYLALINEQQELKIQMDLKIIMNLTHYRLQTRDTD